MGENPLSYEYIPPRYSLRKNTYNIQFANW
jgi:hypothetical protein